MMPEKRYALHAEDRELCERVDQWRRLQPQLMPRSDAVRYLINEGLSAPRTGKPESAAAA